MSDDTLTPILELLRQGELSSEGLLPWSSNYTFLMRVCGADEEIQAVYKPRRGERPLWDFPSGTLCSRECAAFILSQAAGWHLVPPTVLRRGPQGVGSLQWFVPHNPEEHYFTFEGQFPDQVQRMVLFDVLVNNADRKSGHVLLGESNRLWGIDHGICFHPDYKLRTVIWEYAGIPIPPDQLAELAELQQTLALSQPLRHELAQHLRPEEITAIENRLAQLLQAGKFPEPGPGRHYPWPLV